MTVWGDYGRIEGRKIFMGGKNSPKTNFIKKFNRRKYLETDLFDFTHLVAQIMLDDLDLSNIVIGWYKLFGTSSLVIDK